MRRASERPGPPIPAPQAPLRAAPRRAEKTSLPPRGVDSPSPPFWRPDNPLLIGALLALLSVVPVWLTPMAPLTDWPAHLAISSEIKHLWLDGAAHPYYYLEWSFWGYSLVHIVLALMMSVMPWQLAGQLMLTTLMLLSPLCWREVFRRLAPEKEEWFVFGTLLNYSAFFYWGNINFLFAVCFGLLWLAWGLPAAEGRGRPMRFLLAGTLTYFCHGYLFFIVGGTLAAAMAYRRLWEERSGDGFVAGLLVLMLILAGLNTLSNPSVPRDYGYAFEVNTCSQRAAWTADPVPADAKYIPSMLVAGVLRAPLNPLEFMQSAFPLIHLAYIAAGLSAILAFWALREFLLHNRAPRQTLGAWGQRLGAGQTGVEWGYAALAGLMMLHYVAVPPCPGVCGMNLRTLPLFAAFALLAIKAGRGGVRALFWAMAALAAINILYQTAAFADHAEQDRIMARLERAAEGMRPGAAVLVMPSKWNSAERYEGYGPYRQPRMHAMLLLFNPRLQVSGLFMFQDTFILRSRFPIYDELTELGPSAWEPGDLPACFGAPPKEYGYVMGQDMAVRPNPAADGDAPTRPA